MEAKRVPDRRARRDQPTLVAFAAPSGTGKTTLVTRVIAQLKAQGHRVGAVKSDAHGVELDTPGKDTHRMRDSGAETTALVSRDQIAIFRDAHSELVPLQRIVEVFFADLDFVLAEGFRSHGAPTIVVRRRGIDFEGWTWPENVCAIVSDAPESDLPCFHLDDIEGVAAFVCGLRGAAEAGEAA